MTITQLIDIDNDNDDDIAIEVTLSDMGMMGKVQCLTTTTGFLPSG